MVACFTMERSTVSHHPASSNDEGVHVGESPLKAKDPVEWRSAVSFQSEETKDFLRKYELM